MSTPVVPHRSIVTPVIQPCLIDATLYERFRPLYPPETFERALGLLSPLPSPIQVLDLGCGTGKSVESLVAASTAPLEITAVDPDASVLKKVQGATTVCAPAEALPFLSGTFDLVQVGSALHWMDIPAAWAEMKRVLKPGGVFHLFEYQFPHCLDHPKLNEWIKTGFNREWKPSSQTPRGRFRDLIAPILKDPLVKKAELKAIPMVRTLQVEEICGLLWSQSRFLHFLETIAPEKHRDLWSTHLQALSDAMEKQESAEFDFRLASASGALKT